MANIIHGKVFVLGDNIDTDQIIPAKYLVYSLDDPEEQKKYGEFALSGVPIEKSGLPNGNIPFVKKENNQSDFTVVLAGKNFGCGSSREHAPAAMQIAGVRCVVAPSYARIFYRNAVDGGFIIPVESEKSLVEYFHTGDPAEINLQEKYILNQRTNQKYPVKGLGEVEGIIADGGIFAYARNAGMLEG
ncbi:MAG: 3-isopropylmalate dehydratase [Calditrichota bacterium]|jgi:3-isopropylmalate/(R)-2-methylmalate dehydratase small subunit